MKKLMIIGAGGHGKVVADIASLSCNFSEIFFLDDKECENSLPYPLVGKVADFKKYISDCSFFVAIGNNAVREKIYNEIASLNGEITSIIHPNAVIGANVVIGNGTVVMAGAVINTGTEIGKGVIINTCSSVDHDCKVGDFSHISVGAHVCGTVNIGPLTWIGSGAIVINNISICEKCLIGAGSVVVKNIEKIGKYIGVPARLK